MMSICWTYEFMQTLTCIYFPWTPFFFQQTNPLVRFWPYWLTRTLTIFGAHGINGSLGQSKFRDSTFINVWYSEKANQSYCLKHHINQCQPEFAEFICAKIIKDLSNRNSSADISYLEPQCLAYKTNKIILPFRWIEHVQFTAEGASAFIAS